MSFAKREMQEVLNLRIVINVRRLARDGAILATIAVFLTLTNVYGVAQGQSVVTAWGFWMVTLLTGTAAGWVTFALIEDTPLTRPRAIMALIASALTSSAAVTGVVYALQSLSGPQIPISELPEMFISVLVITLGIMAIGFLIERAFNSGETDPAQETRADPTEVFLERLPMKYRGAELYAVSSEDHYLRVHTDRGEEMILMRLADAVRELSAADGLQTHRSWWVAAAGVADVRRDSGKITLQLKSGSEAPVSRTYQKSAREKGLI